MNYAHTLQDLRRRDGLTQVAAARLLGFTPNTVCRVEAGKRAADARLQRLVLLWQRQGLEALRAVQP